MLYSHTLGSHYASMWYRSQGLYLLYTKSTMAPTKLIRSSIREALSELTIEDLASIHDDVSACFVRLIKHSAWKRRKKTGYLYHDPDDLLDVIIENLSLKQLASELKIFLSVYFESLEEEEEEEEEDLSTEEEE